MARGEVGEGGGSGCGRSRWRAAARGGGVASAVGARQESLAEGRRDGARAADPADAWATAGDGRRRGVADGEGEKRRIRGREAADQCGTKRRGRRGERKGADLCCGYHGRRAGVSKFIESYLTWKLSLNKYGLKPAHPFVEGYASCQMAILPDGFFEMADRDL
ncbi:hypothetical protein BAE44_0024300 [Dichanthelium oligosanthes]|uniref:Uncharacterized protein n=1 Tax=Dichanthelium oligosanthes TaxID=888268 RepID=A0A1E5UP81_9POAL|nr:hypothetical protein BAE44_0024300 [Dichanthelium oligosanthes]